MNLAVVVGAATPPGRLAAAAQSLVDQARHDLPAVTVDTIDLAVTSVDVCDGRPLDQYSSVTQDVVARMSTADAAVIFSPTYRASYPGVLKNLLDLLPVAALRSKPVGIVAMGASDHHYLGVDAQLRAVLAWFGAVIAPVSVYLTSRDFDPRKRPSDARVAELGELCRSVVRLTEALGGTRLGPDPLAERSG